MSRLCADCVELERHLDATRRRESDLKDDRKELSARVAVLEAALRPFVAKWRDYEDGSFYCSDPKAYAEAARALDGDSHG